MNHSTPVIKQAPQTVIDLAATRRSSEKQHKADDKIEHEEKDSDLDDTQPSARLAMGLKPTANCRLKMPTFEVSGLICGLLVRDLVTLRLELTTRNNSCNE